MRKGPYYSEDILVEKMQRGEYNWLDYINHFSEEWQDEYEEYCREYSLSIGNESAEQFVNYKSEQLEKSDGRRKRLISTDNGYQKEY